MRFFLIIAITGLFVGCTKEPAFKKKPYTPRTMNSVSSGVELPVSLWSLLEAVPAAEEHKSDGHGGSKNTSNEPLPTKFMAIKVYLAEKNRGILNGENVELSFHEGGGELDLADFTASKQGSFYIAIEPVFKTPDDSKPKLDVFYLSNAVKRNVEHETFGAGCNTYHKISHFFEKTMKHDGILVNTTAGRHVSQLAGTYFFAIPHGGRLHLAHLTIKDSRFRSLQCRR